MCRLKRENLHARVLIKVASFSIFTWLYRSKPKDNLKLIGLLLKGKN